MKIPRTAVLALALAAEHLAAAQLAQVTIEDIKQHLGITN